MEFSFTYEQQAIRELAGKIFGDRVTHQRLLVIESGRDLIDRELWRKLAEASLLGTALPEQHGGGGLGFFEFCMVLEEAGRVVAPIPLVPAVVLAALPIAEFGSDRQKERDLPRLCAGGAILTAALVEVGSSDPARPRLTATRDGSAWRLDGEKVCVPAGQLAERILVPASTGKETIGVFLLDPATSGVTLEAQQATNREPQARLTCSGAAVDGNDVLGDPDGGESIVRWIEDRAALGLSALQ
ncbi:MAG: acyl-CoA/acyl-ACP dehydrogenase, partial [Deltaproteobacteria bacterium]|nr:acyl-CoA/acyl-ACP dehydrogenase [Deltaproteobacteria bacterium]